MNFAGWVIWGFVATLVLTGILAGSQGLRITRLNLPFLVGTMFTGDRDKAKWIGFFVHLLNGWVFSFVYLAGFYLRHGSSVWLGALAGAVHGALVLLVVFPLLPGVHPRMASEHQGPVPVKPLEPPGFLALHYGRRTPLSIFAAHVVFGAILGAFYELPRL